MSNPFQDLKVGDFAYYWFKVKGRAKRNDMGKIKLGYRGVRKVRVAAVGDKTITLADGSVFERATGKASFPQEIQEAARLTTIIIPKRILKPGKAKW